MPAVVEGVELSAVAVLWFIVAFLLTLKWTVTPLLSALHHALGWVPFLGGLIGDAETRIINALNAAIVSVEGAAVDLWHGVIWSFGETVVALEDLAHKTEGALGYLWSQSIPHYANALLTPVRKAVAAVDAGLADLTGYAHRQVDRLDALIGKTAAATLATARADLVTAEGLIRRDFVAQLDALEATLRSDIGTAVRGAEQQASSALATVAAAEAAAIGQAERLGELSLDELKQLAGGLDFRTIAALLASIPLLRALIDTIAAETGLDNAACRSKVKGICSTDPQRWARLLALLALPIEWPGLIELVRWLETLFGDALTATLDLAQR